MLGWGTPCLPPLWCQCRLDTYREMSYRMKCSEITWSIMPSDKPCLDREVFLAVSRQRLCFCANFFCSANIWEDLKPMQLCKNSAHNEWRSVFSCLRLPWGSLLKVRAFVSLAENMSFAHSSSTFLRLLCKVKAFIMRTCCPWLVLTKGSGWKPPTHTHTNTHTSLHL